MEKFGFVLATKMLVEGKRKVRYMYHEKTTNSQDSGWRFFCGEEDDDYVNNPDNISAGVVLKLISLNRSKIVRLLSDGRPR